MAGRVITDGLDYLPTSMIRCARKVAYRHEWLDVVSMPTRWERLKIMYYSLSSVESVLNALSANIHLHPRLLALEIRPKPHKSCTPRILVSDRHLPLLGRLTSLTIWTRCLPVYQLSGVTLPALEHLDVSEASTLFPFSTIHAPSLKYLSIQVQTWRTPVNIFLQRS